MCHVVEMCFFLKLDGRHVDIYLFFKHTFLINIPFGAIVLQFHLDLYLSVAFYKKKPEKHFVLLIVMLNNISHLVFIKDSR